MNKLLLQRLLMMLLSFLFVNNLFAATPQLNPHLGAKNNPVLTPDQLQGLPYVKLFMNMNAVPMLVWNDQGGLVAANDAYLQLIGYTRAEMLAGKIDWVTITPPEYRKFDENCIKQLQAQSYCNPYTKEYVRKDGHRIKVKLWNAREKGGKNIAIILPSTK